MVGRHNHAVTRHQAATRRQGLPGAAGGLLVEYRRAGAPSTCCTCTVCKAASMAQARWIGSSVSASPTAAESLQVRHPFTAPCPSDSPGRWSWPMARVRCSWEVISHPQPHIPPWHTPNHSPGKRTGR